MTRIIAGSAAGSRLLVPARGTRPTSDRVREALFSSLEHRLGGWDGVRVLDCYAGTGALALEALSRGAASAVAVEQSASAVRLINRNAQVCGLSIKAVQSDVVAYLSGPAGPLPFDLVMLDPPYDSDPHQVASALANLQSGWLGDSAVVVLEAAARHPAPDFPASIEIEADKRYGDTRLWYGRHDPAIG